MNAAAGPTMSINLKSLTGGRTYQMTGRMFAKLLSLARLEGWRPERLPPNWASSSSDTEIILQEMQEFGEGLVSKVDARGLSEALSRVAKNGGAALGPELCLAILDFNNLFGGSGFIVTEAESGDTVFFKR